MSKTPATRSSKARRPSSTTHGPEGVPDLLGWVANDGVVDPAAVGWNNAQAMPRSARARPRSCRWLDDGDQVLADTKVAGKYAYAVMPTIPPGATNSGRRHRGHQHPVRRQPRRRRVPPSRTCRSTSSSGHGPQAHWSTTRSSATCPRTPTRPRSWRTKPGSSSRSSTRQALQAGTRSPAPGARSSSRSSTSSCSRSRLSRAARSPTPAAEAAAGRAEGRPVHARPAEERRAVMTATRPDGP